MNWGPVLGLVALGLCHLLGDLQVLELLELHTAGLFRWTEPSGPLTWQHPASLIGGVCFFLALKGAVSPSLTVNNCFGCDLLISCLAGCN